MPLLQQEGIDAMKEFLAGIENLDEPDYVRGLIQAIVEVYEDAGVNMTPILRDALSALLQGNE